MNKYISKANRLKVYYHGSPNSDIEVLRSNSYITPYLYIAIEFGRYHLYSGKTWSDEDLIKKYNFIEGPFFKEDSKPTGMPTIYKVVTRECDIDSLNNPFEHKTKIDIKVEKLRLFNICSL